MKCDAFYNYTFCNVKIFSQNIQYSNIKIFNIVIWFLIVINQKPFWNFLSELCLQYLNMVRVMDGYNTIVFPHCGCGSRKDGDIILAVGFSQLTIRACDYEGNLQVWFII